MRHLHQRHNPHRQRSAAGAVPPLSTTTAARRTTRALPPQQQQQQVDAAPAASASKQPQQQQQNDSNPLITGLVSAMTESLRLLGVGQQRYQVITQLPPPNPPLQPGATQELVQRLAADFQRAYFVTGLIDDSIYVPDCAFIDPTVSFKGVDLWKRNLQLLVPFLIQPSITLHSTRIQAAADPQTGPPEVEAEWRLATWLSLPWRPYIKIEGRTVYSLTADANQIVRHEEFWDVSPLAAILMMFKPGPPVPDVGGESERGGSGGVSSQ